MLYCSIFPMCLTKFWFSGSRVHRLTSEPYRKANDNSSLLVLGNPGERWVCLNADCIRLVNAICIYTQLPEGHRFVMFCLWCSFYFHPLPKSGGYISCSEDEGFFLSSYSNVVVQLNTWGTDWQHDLCFSVPMTFGQSLVCSRSTNRGNPSIHPCIVTSDPETETTWWQAEHQSHCWKPTSVPLFIF